MGLWFAWAGCSLTAFVQRRAKACGEPAWGFSALWSLNEEPGEFQGGHTEYFCWRQCRFWDGPYRVRANKPICMLMYLLPNHPGFRRAFQLGSNTRFKLVLQFCIAQPTKYYPFCWEPCRAGHRDSQAILQGQEKSRWMSWFQLGTSCARDKLAQDKSVPVSPAQSLIPRSPVLYRWGNWHPQTHPRTHSRQVAELGVKPRFPSLCLALSIRP